MGCKHNCKVVVRAQASGSLTSCVVTGKLLNLSEPEFLLYKMGIMLPNLHLIVIKIQWDNICKAFNIVFDNRTGT